MKPNKKLEELLNSKADSSLIGKLCRNGIISSVDYLKAVSFCRDDSFWAVQTASLLRLFGGLFAVIALFLFCLNFWEYAYTSTGFYVVFFVFTCLCIRALIQGKLSFEASIFSLFLIALLVVLPELRFGTGTPFYQQARMFAVFTTLFALASGSFFLFPVAALAVNVSLCANAITVYLPAGVWTRDFFLTSVFLLNVVALLGCEFVAYKKKTKNTFYLRPVLFACAVFILFIPLLHSVVDQEYLCLFPYFIILTPVFLSAAIFFYAVLNSDLFVKQFSVGALCVWIELFLYRFMLANSFSNPLAFIGFAFTSFFSIVAVLKMTDFFDNLRRTK